MASLWQGIQFTFKNIFTRNQLCRKQLSNFSSCRSIFLTAKQCSFSDMTGIQESSNNVALPKKNQFLTDFTESAIELEDSESMISKNLIRMKELNSFENVQTYINNLDELSHKQALSLMYHLRFLNPQISAIPHGIDSINNFVNSSAFLKLCNTIEKKLPTFTTKNLTFAVTFLSLYEVPYSSTIFQKVLKLVLENFNKLAPFQVLTIYKNLFSQNSSSNNIYVRYAKLACLEYMVYCFDSKGIENEPLKSVAYFSCQKFVPAFIREKLLLKFLDSNYSFASPKILCQIAKAISSPDVLENLRQDDFNINKFVQTIKSKINESWNFEEIKAMNRALCIGCGERKMPYHEDLFDFMAMMTVKNQLSIPEALTIMNYLCSLPHLNNSLLMYITNRIFISQNEPFHSLNLAQVHTLINILGTTGFNRMEGVNWDFYRNKLLSFRTLPIVGKSQSLSNFYSALNLAVLGIYDNEFMSSALALCMVDLNTLLRSQGKTYQKWCILLLNQSLSIMHPSFNQVELSNNSLKEMAESIHSKVSSSSWSKVVQTSFGGKNYVLEQCTTRLHHSLAYVVVLDEYNRAIDVSSYKADSSCSNTLFNVDDIRLEPNQRIVIILEFSSSLKLYFKNVDSLIGFGDLYVKVLEAMGYSVIHVRKEKYDELMEVERVPYFINLVEQKCGHLPGRTLLNDLKA